MTEQQIEEFLADIEAHANGERRLRPRAAVTGPLAGRGSLAGVDLGAMLADLAGDVARITAEQHARFEAHADDRTRGLAVWEATRQGAIDRGELTLAASAAWAWSAPVQPMIF